MFMHRTGTWQIHNTGFYFASKFVAYYPPSDMLIAWTAEATQRLQGWKCDGSNGGAKYLTLTGTPPTQTGAAKWPAQLGFTWSPLKNAFVSYGGGIVASSYGAERVFYLTPPAVGQEFTGTWTWSSEDFTSGDGSTPPTEGYGNEGATAMWEIPQWSRPGQVTLLECGSWRRAPQVRVTLAG
jgi:hypothetical protein